MISRLQRFRDRHAIGGAGAALEPVLSWRATGRRCFSRDASEPLTARIGKMRRKSGIYICGEHQLGNLDAARAARRISRAAGIKIVPRSPIAKALANPKSLRAALDAKCFDCEGGGADPHWKQRIGNCVCPDCPLYPLRPYQNLRAE